MIPQLSPVRSAAAFYVLAFGLVTTVALAGGNTAAAMLTPLTATLLMLLVVTREGWRREGWAGLGLHRLGLRTWPVAVVVPVAVNVLAGVSIVLVGVGSWDPEGQVADLAPVLWPVGLLMNIAFASLTVSVAEEVGWRGYLVPHLAPLGERPAMLLSGALHAVWHLPFILLTGLYLADGSKAVVVPMFLLCATAAGVFTGWLRLRTDSVWPAVLAHSAHNVGVLWVAEALAGDPAGMELVGGESGVVTVLAYVGVAVVLLLRGSGRRSPADGHGTTRRTTVTAGG